jgi:hypothetical protein
MTLNYDGCSVSKVPYVTKIKWEVIKKLNLARLFHLNIIIFQHNARVHWCIFPILARD